MNNTQEKKDVIPLKLPANFNRWKVSEQLIQSRKLLREMENERNIK